MTKTGEPTSLKVMFVGERAVARGAELQRAGDERPRLAALHDDVVDAVPGATVAAGESGPAAPQAASEASEGSEGSARNATVRRATENLVPTSSIARQQSTAVRAGLRSRRRRLPRARHVTGHPGITSKEGEGGAKDVAHGAAWVAGRFRAQI